MNPIRKKPKWGCHVCWRPFAGELDADGLSIMMIWSQDTDGERRENWLQASCTRCYSTLEGLDMLRRKTEWLNLTAVKVK